MTSTFSLYKCTKLKFDFAVKISKVILWSSFEQTVDLESLMLYTKIQPKSLLGYGEEDF